MQVRRDVSYGIIPLRWQSDAWETLLINQISKIGNNTYWVFPKGHPERQETPMATAARELTEETGLFAGRILPAPVFSVAYDFEWDGERIEKRVDFFLGTDLSGTLTLEPDEVKEAKWLTLEAAADRLDYADTKRMFKTVTEYLADKTPTELEKS